MALSLKPPDVEYPAEPPPGWVWRPKQVWSCRLHERPVVSYWDDDEDDSFDFPAVGCSCRTSAAWVDSGEWQLEMRWMVDYMDRVTRDVKAQMTWLENFLDAKSTKASWGEDELRVS